MGVVSGILGVGGAIAGLLDDDEDPSKSAEITARKSYPGQYKLAETLAPFLSENIDTGLTEKEKRLFRGSGKTSILRGTESARRGVTRGAASQGLRGGTIADMIGRIEQSKIPAFAGLESDIATKDIDVRRKRIEQILAFLSLQAGINPDSTGGVRKKRTIQDEIEDILQGGGPGIGTGGGAMGGLGPGPGGGTGGAVGSGEGAAGSPGGGIGGIM